MLRELINRLTRKTDPTIISSLPEPEPYALSLITHHASKQEIKSVGVRDLQIALDECGLCHRTERPVQISDVVLANEFAPRIRRELHRRGVM